MYVNMNGNHQVRHYCRVECWNLQKYGHKLKQWKLLTLTFTAASRDTFCYNKSDNTVSVHSVLFCISFILSTNDLIWKG